MHTHTAGVFRSGGRRSVRSAPSSIRALVCWLGRSARPKGGLEHHAALDQRQLLLPVAAALPARGTLAREGPMVTDEQVRLMRRKRMEGKTQEAAAAAAGMRVRSARFFATPLSS